MYKHLGKTPFLPLLQAQLHYRHLFSSPLGHVLHVIATATLSLWWGNKQCKRCSVFFQPQPLFSSTAPSFILVSCALLLWHRLSKSPFREAAAFAWVIHTLRSLLVCTPASMKHLLLLCPCCSFFLPCPVGGVSDKQLCGWLVGCLLRSTPHKL